MSLKKNKYRSKAVVLRWEHEYVSILRDILGAPNDFGERDTTTSTVSTNTKAMINPISALSADKLKMFQPGLIAVSSHWMMAEASDSIKPRDTVVDRASNAYSVEEVVNWRTHKEALLAINEKP